MVHPIKLYFHLLIQQKIYGIWDAYFTMSILFYWCQNNFRLRNIMRNCAINTEPEDELFWKLSHYSEPFFATTLRDSTLNQETSAQHLNVDMRKALNDVNNKYKIKIML